MRRREFVTLVGGAAAAWPLVANAQQQEQMRRIGMLAGIAADDPIAQANNAAFVQGLQQLVWIEGRNVRIDGRWAAGNAAARRKYAKELVALAPDVILASASASLESLLQATLTVPIVFTIVPDPVGSGFVKSLSRPGGNATGFMMFEYSLCGKWVGLLKEIAPGVTRVAVLRDAAIPAGIGQFAVIQAVNRKIVLVAAAMLIAGTGISFAQRSTGTGGGAGGSAAPAGPPPSPSPSQPFVNPSNSNTVSQPSYTPQTSSTPSATPATLNTASGGTAKSAANEEATTTARPERGASVTNKRAVHHYRRHRVRSTLVTYSCSHLGCVRTYAWAFPCQYYSRGCTPHGYVASVRWWPGYYDYASGELGRARSLGRGYRVAGYHGD